MRSVRISALGLASAALVLGGCASAPARRTSKTERVCLNRTDINMVRALDEHHVFAKVSAGTFYLFTVEKLCSGLKLARQIAIEGSFVRVCGDGSSLLSFDYPAVGPMRCRIERIDPVQDMAAALELIESRAAPK